MNKEDQNEIFLNMQDLDMKANSLITKENALDKLVSAQNEEFDELIKAYSYLGLLNVNQNFEPIRRDMFSSKFMSLSDNHEKRINKLLSTGNKNEISCQMEKYIADLSILLSNRWNTILKYKKIWKERRCNFRKDEIRLFEKNEQLALSQKLIPSIEWQNQAKLLFSQQKDFQKKQFELLEAEEELHEELIKLFEIRESILKSAVELLSLS